jgi:hypothetical protein
VSVRQYSFSPQLMLFEIEQPTIVMSNAGGKAEEGHEDSTL